jgi:hypothetical protein
MTILASYAALRHHFAEVARTTSVSLTYDNGANTVSRGSGSFVTDGFEAGMSLDVANTTDNDARYTLATVSALSMSIAEQFNSSETITSSLTGAAYANDGAETWPTALVRANGFSSTFGITGNNPITIYPSQWTINALATDVDAGSSYTWYIRQRTDDPDLQWLSVVHANPLHTGTIAVSLTARAVADLGIATALTKLSLAQQLRVLKSVTAFCKRDSDGAIQIVDVLRESHGVG